MKNCSNPDCPKPNPQPYSKFSKESRSKDGYAYLCTYCRNVKAKIRRNLKKFLQSLNIEEQKTIISCFYITSKESIPRLSKMFNISKEEIINILKEEELFEWVVCGTCGFLKHYSEYSVCFNRKSSKGIQTDCKLCVAKKHRDASHEYVKYDIYSPKLKIYEEIRNDNGILEVKCTYCGKYFKPLRSAVDLRVNTLKGYEQKGFSESRLYCSENCKKVCPIYRKSPETLMIEDAVRAGYININELNREVQPELRQMVFKRDNYTCQRCGKHKSELCVGLHCHHIEGIRWNPIESADIDQCLTECQTCHKLIHQQPDCGYYDMRCFLQDKV